MRLVQHRAIRPRDEKVIAIQTMQSDGFWAPVSASGDLYNWMDDLTFQTQQPDGTWLPAMIVFRNLQPLITTPDAFERAKAALAQEEKP